MNLIPRVSEISAGGASVKFNEEAANLADKASSLAEDVIEKSATPSGLAPPPGAVDPTMSFLEAYGSLESAARDAAPTAEIRFPNPTPVQVIRRLAEKDLIPRATVRVAEELRDIRNDVAHARRRLEPIDSQNLANTARSLAIICLSTISPK